MTIFQFQNSSGAGSILVFLEKKTAARTINSLVGKYMLRYCIGVKLYAGMPIRGWIIVVIIIRMERTRRRRRRRQVSAGMNVIKNPLHAAASRTVWQPPLQPRHPNTLAWSGIQQSLTLRWHSYSSCHPFPRTRFCFFHEGGDGGNSSNGCHFHG